MCGERGGEGGDGPRDARHVLGRARRKGLDVLLDVDVRQRWLVDTKKVVRELFGGLRLPGQQILQPGFGLREPDPRAWPRPRSPSPCGHLPAIQREPGPPPHLGDQLRRQAQRGGEPFVGREVVQFPGAEDLVHGVLVRRRYAPVGGAASHPVQKGVRARVPGGPQSLLEPLGQLLSSGCCSPPVVTGLPPPTKPSPRPVIVSSEFPHAEGNPRPREELAVPVGPPGGGSRDGSDERRG